MNPKAAAKAAKAYAKAMRPWYKKKRFLFPAVLVVIIGVLIATNSGGSDSGTKTASGSSSSTKKTTKVFKVGDTVALAGTKYTVTKANTAATLGDEFTKETAGGIYVVVHLTIENTKNETKTFDESNTHVLAGNGKKYDTDSDGTTAAIGSGQDLILADMQPDVPKSGILVYDVPKDAVKGSKLVVSDFWGSGSATIDLNLR